MINRKFALINDIILKILAKIISILFHPLWMLIYLLAILLAINPYMFSWQDEHEKLLFFVYTFMNTLIIPVLAIFIMKMLGFVKSLEMLGKKERIGPMIVIGTLYLWLFINFKNSSFVPDIFISIILGSVIAIFTAFFINNFSKISLHMLGAGGLIVGLVVSRISLDQHFMILTVPNLFNATISIDLLIVLSILLAGMIATARLYLKAHVPRDVYGGLFIGMLSQIIAYLIIF